MKKILSLFVVVLSFTIFYSCQSIDNPVAPNPTPLSNSAKVLIKMADQASNTSVDGNYAVQGIQYIFQAVFDTTIVSTQWFFNDDNTTSSGKYALHIFKSNPPATVTIRLVGLDKNNVSHETSLVLSIVWGTELIKPISVTAAGNNLYTAVIAIPKAIYSKIIPSPTQMLPFRVGDVNHPSPKAWTDSLIFISPADTNSNVTKNSNGTFSLVTPGAGQIGDHVVIRMTLPLALPPNSYAMGTGKINKNGVAEYVNFAGSPFANKQNPTIINFQLSATSITAVGSTTQETMPGEFGDRYVRGTSLTTKLVIYTRLENTFSSSAPFTRVMDTNEVLMTPTVLTPVPGFPEWGSMEILYSDLGTINYRRLHYGLNISIPGTYSTNEPKSDFYDKTRNILGIGFVRMGLNKVSSGQKTENGPWIMVPYK